MLHPELLHEVCGFPGRRRPRLRGVSVEFGLKRRLVGLNDGGAEGKQLLVSLEIDLRLPPELGAEPLRLLAARIDREELQQVLKILHLRRKLRAAVERERDQMPQRLRLGKHLGLLLGDQMIKRPDQPVVIRRVVLEKRLEKLRVLLQLRQNRLLHRLHRCNERRKRLKRDTVFRRKTLADALHGVWNIVRLREAALQNKIQLDHGVKMRKIPHAHARPPKSVIDIYYTPSGEKWQGGSA